MYPYQLIDSHSTRLLNICFDDEITPLKDPSTIINTYSNVLHFPIHIKKMPEMGTGNITFHCEQEEGTEIVHTDQSISTMFIVPQSINIMITSAIILFFFSDILANIDYAKVEPLTFVNLVLSVPIPIYIANFIKTIMVFAIYKFIGKKLF